MATLDRRVSALESIAPAADEVRLLLVVGVPASGPTPPLPRTMLVDDVAVHWLDGEAQCDFYARLQAAGNPHAVPGKVVLAVGSPLQK